MLSHRSVELFAASAFPSTAKRSLGITTESKMTVLRLLQEAIKSMRTLRNLLPFVCRDPLSGLFRTQALMALGEGQRAKEGDVIKP